MLTHRIFQTVETHTVGQSTRIVTGGIPYIPGNSMYEKMLYMKENFDWIRTLLTCEPRGSKHCAAALLTSPCTPETDIGVLYFEPLGWLPMCGHDTIGVGTMLVETGMVNAAEPFTYIKLDTAAGVVPLKIKVENGKARAVSFTNVPAFVCAEDVIVPTKEYGEIVVNISYGGNFYAIVSASDVNLDILPENYNALIKAADKIKPYIREKIKVEHPQNSSINTITHIQFTGPPRSSGAYSQNAVVCTPGGIDRSPCGTGTSARCALLYKKGEIALNEPFIHESIIGSTFSCMAVEETTVGNYSAIIPEVTGSANIMGMTTQFLDPDDPFPEGFLLG